MSDWRERYHADLNDPRWYRRASEIRRRDGNKCCDCGNSDRTLQVHHDYYISGYYVRPWEYHDAALRTLCVKCHKKWHKRHVNVSVSYDTAQRRAESYDWDRMTPEEQKASEEASILAKNKREREKRKKETKDREYNNWKDNQTSASDLIITVIVFMVILFGMLQCVSDKSKKNYQREIKEKAEAVEAALNPDLINYYDFKIKAMRVVDEIADIGGLNIHFATEQEQAQAKKAHGLTGNYYEFKDMISFASKSKRYMGGWILEGYIVYRHNRMNIYVIVDKNDGIVHRIKKSNYNARELRALRKVVRGY